MTATSPSETVPALTEQAARLRLSTTRLARRLRQEGDTGLTPSQLSALATIDRHGPLTLGALAELEAVAPPSITKVAAKLEVAGLVGRLSDAGDRRFVRVAATDAGRQLLARVRLRKTAWLTARLRRLDADQQARLAAALDVLEALASAEDR
jgi:DNA-binding MarR family transcriptional regulator